MQLVNLVVVRVEPCHVALPEIGLSELKSVFLDRVVKGGLNLAV
jgi:hypothetical protein